MWASWDTDILQTFPSHPSPVALWKCIKCSVCVLQSWLWGTEEAQCQCLMSTHPHLGLGFGSLMARVWMSLYLLITVFMNAFHVLLPTWRVKVLLIKISIYLTTPDLAVYPQMSGWLSGGRVTQVKSKANWWNRSLWKQLVPGGSSLCVGR